jgi:hypothetical protein
MIALLYPGPPLPRHAPKRNRVDRNGGACSSRGRKSTPAWFRTRRAFFIRVTRPEVLQTAQTREALKQSGADEAEKGRRSKLREAVKH